GRRMALEPCLVVDAIRSANDRARTALEVLDHPRPDGLEVARELELGDWACLALPRPQCLLGLRDGYAQHILAAALRHPRRGRRLVRGYRRSQCGRGAAGPVGTLVGVPDCAGIGGLCSGRHEWLGAPAFAG